MIENFHGVPYEKPLLTRLPRDRHPARALARRAPAPEMSTLFDARHFKLEMTPFRPDIPVYIASLQEKAVKDVGRVADGWIPTFWPYEHFKDGSPG